MTKRKQKLKWVQQPLQQRSQERLARILDAAEVVIAEKGFDQATIAEIMAKAGSSVGIFYQRFKSKDDLLRCLLDRFSEQSIATTDDVLRAEIWQDVSVAVIVRRTIEFLVNVYREKRGLIRAFLLRASVDVEFNQMAHAAEKHVAKRLSALLLDRAEEIQHSDPADAVTLAYQMLRSTLNTMTLFPYADRSGYSLDDEELPRVLASAFLRQIAAKRSAEKTTVTPKKRF